MSEVDEARVTFYVFDPEIGLDEYDTAEAAERAADEAIDQYREQSGDGWPEEAADVHWGKLIKLGESVEEVLDKPVPLDSEFRYYADFKLRKSACPLDNARAEIDRLRARAEKAEAELAEVRAELDALKSVILEVTGEYLGVDP